MTAFNGASGPAHQLSNLSFKLRAIAEIADKYNSISDFAKEDCMLGVELLLKDLAQEASDLSGSVDRLMSMQESQQLGASAVTN